MIADNIKGKLIISIAFVSLLLLMCIAIDSASDVEINNINDSKLEIPNGTITINDSSLKKQQVIVPKKSDKIYTVKEKNSKSKKPKITVKGYPTCYTCWKTQRYRCVKRTYLNYCHNCKMYGTLRNNPKGVEDGEITCSRCDCDFCCYCGRDKVGSGGRHKWNILIPV